MLAGTSPIRALKARYYADARLMARILPPPETTPLDPARRPANDWAGSDPIAAPAEATSPEEPPASVPDRDASSPASPSGSGNIPSGRADGDAADTTNAGIRREPELGAHEEIAPAQELDKNEFEFDQEDDADGDAARNRRQVDRMMQRNARNASLDPDDGISL